MTANALETAIPTPRRSTRGLVSGAVHQNRLFTTLGLNERTFTLAFSGLVYPQIWEDPAIDLEALKLAPGHRMVAIASGGCNVLSYLTAAPIDITAVDLNRAHIALNRLKLNALANLDQETFYRFFGNAADPANIDTFDRILAPSLDHESREYWTNRDLAGRRRIERFASGFYKSGLLGRFIGMAHALARALGRDPRVMLQAKTLAEQRDIYRRELKPLFERRIVRNLLDRRASLFGLGIPPAQYDALAEGRPMHEVVEERLEKLACGSDLKDNYFAWQAFNRGYAPDGNGPLPPYLAAENFPIVKASASNVHVVQASITDHLAGLRPLSTDRYVLLDAQDWMDDATLTALWREITRTARPGARVIFRTAGRSTILPGRVPATILDQWAYRAEQSEDLSNRDRSAIYGGFHLYEKKV